MERQPHGPAIAAHLVHHAQLPARGGQLHLAAVHAGLVTVVLGAPAGHLLVGGVRDQDAAAGVPGPQERAAGDGLVTAVPLQRVVGEGRPEVLPPLGLPVVAERPRVGEHVDPVVPYLHRQRVRVGVRGDRQETVRTAVATAPDLLRTAQDRQARIGEMTWPARRAGHSRIGARLPVRPDERGQQRSAHIGTGHGRPPGEPAEQGVPGGQQ